MESEQQQTTERDTAPKHWSSCKLIIDPALTNGLYKVYRYDGQHFNIPVQDLGVLPVGAVRDPRICRLWSKCDKTDLSVPKFKIDEYYVGPIPPKEVTFCRLNDNVREGFLTDMCKKYGHIEEVEIFYNPKTKKHLGIAKVIFDTVKAAKDAVQHLHQTSVMGNIIHVEADPKGENRMRYLQLLLSGLHTPWTLPVGSSEQTLQSLIDNLPGSSLIQRHGSISSPTSVATPLSLDTAYSSIWQDTPCSFWMTPRSQGTPRTPCLSGSPLSQDSCYSSLQATPIFQGEPSTYSVHKPLRQEICYRKPARYHGRSRKSSDFSCIFKHFQPQPLLLHAQIHTTGNSEQPPTCGHYLQTSVRSSTEPSFPPSPTNQESREVVPTTSKALPLNCNSVSILSINVTTERQAAASFPPDCNGFTTESSLSAVNASPGSPHPETDSLDSRIEMLLKKKQSADTSYFNSGGLEAAVHPQDSPTSPCSAASEDSLDCAPAPGGSPTISRQPSHNALMDVSATPLLHNEGDETVHTVASYLRNSQSPISVRVTGVQRGANANKDHSKKNAKRLQSLSCPKELQVPNEDKERNNNQQSEALIQTKELSSPPQSPAFSSLHPSTQSLFSKPSSATMSRHSHPPPITPFTFPIPSIAPSVPSFPVRLPNATFPFPPPGWIPPPGCSTGILMPPPPILPLPTLLGPPPPLIAPPSVAHPVHPFHIYRQPSEHLDKGNPPRPGSAPLSFCGPPWPSLPFPMFNPLVPPPGYLPMRENPHKITVEKVLGVLMEELKSIVRRDMTRRMIEGVAFKTFDEWWDCQEKKAKIAAAPLRTGVGIVEERTRPMKDLSHIIGHGKKIQLPSFKVKRKGVPDPATSEEPDSQTAFHGQSSVRENNSCLKNSDVKQRDDIARPTSERANPEGGCSALKRRHARPLELDSDADEEEEEDNTMKHAVIMLDKEEDTVSVDDASKVQCDIGDHDEEEDEEVVQQHAKGEDVIISKTTDGVQFSESETLSETGSSEESECSSDLESSDSYSTQSTEDSSYSDLSSEEDEDMEDGKVDRGDDFIVISSDEESMDLEPPNTPSAPLTPGAELEVGLHDWSKGAHRKGPEEDQYTCQHDPSDLDAMMDFQTSSRQDSVQPSSPIRLPVMEPNYDVEIESPEWRVESLNNIENLRPLTPSGCLLDSDPDLLIRHEISPPAVEDVERPHTPGQGIVAQMENEDCMDELLSLSPTSSEPALSPSELQASYSIYEDMPRTPGAEERGGWTAYNCGRAPATPGRETTLAQESTVRSPPLGSPLSTPSLSNDLYIRAPRTPGSATVHQKNAQMMTTSQGGNAFLPLLCDESPRGSPIVVSSPCSLAESSTETHDWKGVWMSSGVRMKPLQGLENMPGLLHEESRRETEKFLLKREEWRWQKMRRKRRKMRQQQRSLKRVTASLSSSRGPCRRRSLCEEMRVVHSVWKKGLDEEDARLLHSTYERLQQQDNGLGWLSDTAWIPHPLTRVSTEKNEEYSSWQQKHRTGSARSEGFYKISRKDKLKHLNATRLATELSPTRTQGMCIPAQPPVPLRAGSDFRSEQRRLLSSFSCDSDLVKFNQLKFRKKRIRFCRSHIHDWGLFAMEPIAADEMVIEYVGQTIRQVIADMREKRYEDEGIGSSYMFRVDQDTIIDATKCGNLARFINHSCNPNCYAKIITVESQKKIVIYSRQPISINEEITYDYKFPIEDEKIPCLCGADSCRGSLN